MIFARQPVLGTVKTRLAADVGHVEALRFYRTTLARLVRRAASDPSWRTLLAVTPDAARLTMERIHGVPAFPQGPGDLGARMRRAAARQPGPTLIVGSDIPELECRHLRTAFAALRAHDLVFGPAQDGGYWLAGFANRRRVRDVMEGVRWSTPEALADTLRTIRPPLRAMVLDDVLDDVDERTGFERFRRTHAR